MPTSPAPIAAPSAPSTNPNVQSFSAKSKARRRKKKSKFGSRAKASQKKANEKAQDLTIKKLTERSPSRKAKFEAIDKEADS